MNKDERPYKKHEGTVNGNHSGTEDRCFFDEVG